MKTFLLYFGVVILIRAHHYFELSSELFDSYFLAVIFLAAVGFALIALSCSSTKS